MAKELPYIKTIRKKGRAYLYFNAGKDESGKQILKALPPKSDPSFGGVYAAYLGHRTRAQIGELTVPRLVALYQDSKKFKDLAPSSQKLYRIYQGRLAEGMPSAPAGKIGRVDIVRLFDKMSNQTPGAANMMIASVSALYRWGRRSGLVSNRPTDDIDPNDLGEHEPWDETLLATALASDDATVRLAVHLLYYTALRISDVTALRWAQITDAGIAVTPQKTKRHKKDLMIPLHPGLAKELAGRERDLRTILTDPQGKKFTTNKLRNLLQDWAKGKGHDVVPHGLRKNAVIALLECGCSLAETASISHQSLRVVEHYAAKRNQTKLAQSAMTRWAGTDRGNGNPVEN